MKTRIVLGALAALTLAFTSTALAQGLPPGADRQKLMQAQQQMQQAGMQLAAIQQKTLAANPKLDEKRKALEAQLMAAMTKAGATPEKDIEQMTAMQKKLQAAETPAPEKQQLMAQLQQKSMALRQVQQKVMETPEMKKAAEAFEVELKAAMIKTDPKAEALMKQLEEAQATLKKALGGG